MQDNSLNQTHESQVGNGDSDEKTEQDDCHHKHDSEEDKQPDDPSDGCPHYRCHCEQQCFDCGEYFTCRLCHDQVKFDMETDPTKCHQMNRYKVQRIRCLKCKHEQKPQKHCENCGIEFGKYFCSICNMFDNEGIEKQVFHCDPCGICRVGPKETTFHCNTCNACLYIAMKDKHVCKPNLLKQDCMICHQDLHTSRLTVQFLRCGHAIHQKCAMQYIQTSGKIGCPLCKRSMFDPALFEQSGDQALANNPMPDEYKDQKMLILCNDCLKYSEVPFHTMGGKCLSCRSYNTSRADTQIDLQKYKDQLEKDLANVEKDLANEMQQQS